MRRHPVVRNVGMSLLLALVIAGVCTVPHTVNAGATSSGSIAGEGGDALGPIMAKLLDDDTAGLAPDSGSYTNVDLDQGIADFIGTAPGTFQNDFAVTERQLTTAEQATAKANGRSYAYVPFAATPVALVTLEPLGTYTGSQAISWTGSSSDFCQHIQLSLAQLDGIYGSPAYSNWGDPSLGCTTPSGPLDPLHFYLWANADPTQENFALMSLLDSTTASEALFGAGLTANKASASTTDPTASEHWPYPGTSLTGGDKATLGKLVGLDPRTGAPSTDATQVSLGAIMPVANDWTGAPDGVTWNLPTAAVDNDAGTPTVPTAAAAQAAQNDATLAATSDPTTNNLVTFNATGPDAADAYNHWLMMESYLLVPTNGLSADKAVALAQFIRFVVGKTGQADITALGAAPATQAMQTADLAVAQTLDAEAGAAPSATSSTTTTSATGSGTGSSSNSTATTVASSAAATGNTGSGSSPSTGATSTGGLAVTGSNPVPLIVLGVALLVCGEAARQLLRRRRSRA